jgi:hypothetical protein
MSIVHDMPIFTRCLLFTINVRDQRHDYDEKWAWSSVDGVRYVIDTLVDPSTRANETCQLLLPQSVCDRWLSWSWQWLVDNVLALDPVAVIQTRYEAYLTTSRSDRANAYKEKYQRQMKDWSPWPMGAFSPAESVGLSIGKSRESTRTLYEAEFGTLYETARRAGSIPQSTVREKFIEARMSTDQMLAALENCPTEEELKTSRESTRAEKSESRVQVDQYGLSSTVRDMLDDDEYELTGLLLDSYRQGLGFLVVCKLLENVTSDRSSIVFEDVCAVRVPTMNKHRVQREFRCRDEVPLMIMNSTHCPVVTPTGHVPYSPTTAETSYMNVKAIFNVRVTTTTGTVHVCSDLSVFPVDDRIMSLLSPRLARTLRAAHPEQCLRDSVETKVDDLDHVTRDLLLQHFF